MNILKKLVVFGAAFLIAQGAAAADEVLLKPFILGSKGPGAVAEKTEAAKAALTANGFSVVGTYSPYANASVLVVTNDALKANAAKSELGAFGAMQRVSITKQGNDVQVAYTNPVYMANAYRMAGDLKGVATALEKALGNVEAFGAKGLTAAKLRKYHYTFGMEYFDEPSVLAEHKSHEEALSTLEKNLAAGTNGVTKVYRIDIPGKQETVIGVAMKGKTKADKSMDEQYIMSEIDFKDIRSTAHLPYEVVVSGKKTYALYARFRIAISFPDLSMMGSNSFMNIMSSPEAIRKALVLTAGGIWDEDNR